MVREEQTAVVVKAECGCAQGWYARGGVDGKRKVDRCVVKAEGGGAVLIYQQARFFILFTYARPRQTRAPLALGQPLRP
jgi:hypothetical protein